MRARKINRSIWIKTRRFLTLETFLWHKHERWHSETNTNRCASIGPKWFHREVHWESSVGFQHRSPFQPIHRSIIPRVAANHRTLSSEIRFQHSWFDIGSSRFDEWCLEAFLPEELEETKIERAMRKVELTGERNATVQFRCGVLKTSYSPTE